ncbi:MAG: hypothetical protein ACOC2P_01745 [Spirochaetota bacterium]
MNRILPMHLLRAGLLIVLLSAALPLSAQEFRFVAFLDYYGGIEPEEGYENLRARLFMRPRFSGFHEGLNFEWLLSAALWVQPLQPGGGTYEGGPYAIDSWDILHEAYLLFPYRKFDLSLGQKIVTYGFADVYGPLNALHSTNRTPLSLDDGYDNRRPDPLVQLRFYPSFEDTIELTYVPFTRPYRERSGSVYLPDTQDTVVWSDDPYITDNPHSLFFNYNRYGLKADWQLFYGWYTEHTPDFEISQIDSAVPTDIETVYHKKHTFGVAYSTRLGNTTLSQDFAFNLTNDLSGKDIGAQNSDLTVNTQLLTNLPGDILGQFSLIYSYFFNHNGHKPGSDPEAAEYLAEEIQSFHTQPLQHIAFLVSHFEKSFLREKLKTQLNLGFFFSPEIYLAPRLAYSLSDYWSLESGADITLGPPPDTDLRRNPWNDNFYIRLLYRY